MVDAGVERAIADARAREDLAAAATAAVRGYGPQILGYLRLTLGAEKADDAFSIFCESLWKGIKGFRAESSFLTWAYQLAWGATQRVIASPYRRRHGRLSSTAMEQLAVEIRSTAPPYLQTAEAKRLDRIRAQLDASEQTLLTLRIDRDMPWQDIAVVMDTDAAALRKRFERLKVKIKKLTEEDRERSRRA